ncbi:MAG: TrmH family RNA methyltransferase [Bacteroidota bacterium]
MLAGSTPHPPHPKIARTARSTEKSISWAYLSDPIAFLNDPASFYDNSFLGADFRRSKHRGDPQISGATQTSSVDTGLLLPKVEQHFFLALEVTDQSESLLDFSLPQRLADGLDMLWLVAGNEVHGLSQPVLDRCQASVHLPMHGQNTSMNVGLAIGAAAYLLLDKWAKR